MAQFYVDVKMPAGTNIYTTNDALLELERRIMKPPIKEIAVMVTSPGKRITEREWVIAKSGGQIMIEVVEKKYRNRSIKEIIKEVRKRCEGVTGVESIDFKQFRGGPPTPRDIELKVQGKYLDTLEEIVARIEDELANTKGVFDISNDFSKGKNDVKIYINEDKAALYGLDVYQISMAIRNAYEGAVATIFREGDDEVDVVVKYQEKAVKSIEDIRNLKIATTDGDLIPFRNIATLKIEPGYDAIRRYKQERVITVTAAVDRELNSLEKVDKSLRKEIDEILSQFPGYKVRFESIFEEFQKYMIMLIQLFILGVFLIYFILGTQFKSYIQPIIILFAIPFAFLGAIVGVLLTGLFTATKPIFSLVVFYGIIGLAGIAVNDAIVMVTFINNARAKGVRRWKSIIQSGRLRLRAIILTSVTTMFGVFPMVIGLGGKSEIWAPMASTIFFGLACATLLTLFIIPCLYSIIIDDISGWIRRQWERIVNRS
jgi:multidrug efflux pump subunit AcrB